VEKAPALVLCCQKPGLAVIRALAREDVPVVGLCYGQGQVGAVSRHLAERHWCPDPNEDEPGFCRFLLSLAGRHAGGVLFPTDDAGLVAVSRNRERLLPSFRVVAEEWQIVRKLVEKRLTYELAREHGVPCPRICVTRDPDEARAFAAGIGYPCLVKPSVGHEFFHRYKAKMLTIDGPERLGEVIGDLADYGAELMLSELIPGDDTCGVNYNSFYVDGVPVAEFTAEKLRLRPTGIGFPTAVVSKRLPEVVELGRRMIAAFGYNGFSCMEFKRDARDGTYKLMELNGRHNRSGSLAVACGINFPCCSYLHALGEKLPAGQPEQAEGVYWLDEVRDFRGLLTAWRNGGGGTGAYARPYLRRHASAVLSLSDPRPGMRMLADAFRGLVAGGPRAGKPSRGRSAAEATAAD
jgi:D-aspartate ligase